MPYCVDRGSTPFLQVCVVVACPDVDVVVEQLDARSLFVGMSQPSEPAYDYADRQMFEMIHDRGGGCYEERQVDDSESTDG